MTDVTIIVIGQSVTAIAVAIIGIFNKREITSKVASIKEDLHVEIKEVHTEINGRMGELINLTAKASKAEGNLEARAEIKNEQDKKQ